MPEPVDDAPSYRPVLFVLGLFLAAVIAAMGTTGLSAAPSTPRHAAPSHAVHGKLFLAASPGRP